MKRLRIAVVGCGHICDQYGRHIQKYLDQLEIAGGTDLDPARAERFCKEYGGMPYPDFDSVINDPTVDVVLNLAIARVHFDLNARALRAGKHVYSEKPMALTHAQAVELAEIARQHGRLLGAAPITFLGEGVQTAAKFLEADKLGQLRLVYAEVNWAQIERWISAPGPYFSVGPLLDVGVYAITALTFLLGPVRRVWGYSTIIKNPRFDKDGREFPVTAPDFSTGVMEFESGVIARLTTNYYVSFKSQAHLRGVEFHGDDGSFALSCYHDFNPRCRYIPYEKAAIDVPLLRPGQPGVDRALGLAEMASAIRENRPLRNSPEHAIHVIEIMEGLQRSSDESCRVDIHSTFEKPPLMDWAKEAELVMNEPAPANVF